MHLPPFDGSIIDFSRRQKLLLQDFGEYDSEAVSYMLEIRADAKVNG